MCARGGPPLPPQRPRQWRWGAAKGANCGRAGVTFRCNLPPQSALPAAVFLIAGLAGTRVRGPPCGGERGQENQIRTPGCRGSFGRGVGGVRGGLCDPRCCLPRRARCLKRIPGDKCRARGRLSSAGGASARALIPARWRALFLFLFYLFFSER